MRRTTSCRFFVRVCPSRYEPFEKFSGRSELDLDRPPRKRWEMQTASASQQYVTGYFESTADYWRRVYSDDTLLPTIYQDRHNTALGWILELDLPPNARILEVGCGAGLITVALARSGYIVDAVDSTPAMLQMTRSEAVHHGVQDHVRTRSAD